MQIYVRKYLGILCQLNFKKFHAYLRYLYKFITHHNLSNKLASKVKIITKKMEQNRSNFSIVRYSRDKYSIVQPNIANYSQVQKIIWNFTKARHSKSKYSKVQNQTNYNKVQQHIPKQSNATESTENFS